VLFRSDHLTGALNRRGLDAAFKNESNRADRHNTLLCVAMLDIDNFKHINDTLGHQVGDQALAHLGKVIKHTLRPSDTIARYGGEEFIILMPDVDLNNAITTLERLQRELTRKYFLHRNEQVLVTFSAGVAQRTPHESQEEVISRADKAMYRAKKAGKNRTFKAP
jgi:diguanylate cyclase